MRKTLWEQVMESLGTPITIDLVEVEPLVFVPPSDPRVKKEEPDFTGTFKSSPFIFGTGGGFKPGEGFWVHDEFIIGG